MHVRYLSLIYTGCLIMALATAGAAVAVQAPGSTPELRALVKEAQEKLALMRQQLKNLDTQLQRNAESLGSAAAIAGPSFSGYASQDYSDLRRSATRLADIGNDVLHLTASCESDSSKVGSKFKTQTWRLRSSVDRIGSASNTTSARSMIGKIEIDLNSTEEQLQYLTGMEACGS